MWVTVLQLIGVLCVIGLWQAWVLSIALWLAVGWLIAFVLGSTLFADPGPFRASRR